MTQPYTPGAPYWIELGSTDPQAAHRFYGELFGWDTQELGPEAGGYGFFLKDGKMVAGVGQATDADRGTSWAPYFGTQDAAETAQLVTKHGGAVIAEPMEVMEEGKMAVFTDPNGAYFSVFQPPANNRGLEVRNEVGGLSWVELYSTDIETAKAFYTAVFPLSARDVPMGDDVSYTLFEVDGNAVAGGMTTTQNAWGIYFEVDDVDAIADKALSLGATQSLRDDSPAGRFAALVDPQGGAFSIVKTNPDFNS